MEIEDELALLTIDSDKCMRLNPPTVVNYGSDLAELEI